MTYSKSKPFHVAIVGGGIGGVTFAIGLMSHPHISFTIYEAGHEFTENGAGLGLGANSHLAMKLIDPRIWDGYSKRTTLNAPMNAKAWFSFQFGEKGPLEGKSIVDVGMKDEWTQTVIHRAHFLEELVKLVPKEMAEFNKRLVDVDQSGERVVLSFADGTTAEADTVVGCDGVRSACRGLVLGQESEFTPPKFANRYVYRGMVPMKELIPAIGEEKATTRQMYLGRGGHIITIPINKGSTVAVIACHVQDKTKGWEGKGVKTGQHENMMKDFSHWGDLVTKILSLTACDVWPVFEQHLAPTYHKSRLCLLGDSAHACTPHLGAGAGMALEDAYILSQLLGACTRGRSDILSAFDAYDAVRIPRTHWVSKKSREQGALLSLEHFDGDVEGLRAKLEDERIMGEVWNLDLVGMLNEALEKFEKGREMVPVEVVGGSRR